MSKYTTGEIAKLCGVTVRTVQYYDSRNILVPNELSEGGRRLYSEEDLRRMKLICFLRDLGLPISSIAELLEQGDSDDVIRLLLEQQGQALRGEIRQCQEKLKKLELLTRELKAMDTFSVDSIGDIARKMENRRKLRTMRMVLLAVGILLDITQIAAVAVGILKGIWWPLGLWLLVDILVGIWLARYYFDRAAYICPQCHKVFKPRFWEMFWARHTPTLRKLTCTGCGHHGFCIETYDSKEE